MSGPPAALPLRLKVIRSPTLSVAHFFTLNIQPDFEFNQLH